MENQKIETKDKKFNEEINRLMEIRKSAEEEQNLKSSSSYPIQDINSTKKVLNSDRKPQDFEQKTTSKPKTKKVVILKKEDKKHSNFSKLKAEDNFRHKRTVSEPFEQVKLKRQKGKMDKLRLIIKYMDNRSASSIYKTTPEIQNAMGHASFMRYHSMIKRYLLGDETALVWQAEKDLIDEYKSELLIKMEQEQPEQEKKVIDIKSSTFKRQKRTPEVEAIIKSSDDEPEFKIKTYGVLMFPSNTIKIVGDNPVFAQGYLQSMKDLKLINSNSRVVKLTVESL